MTIIIWTVGVATVIAIGAFTIWVPLIMLGIASSSSEESEGEVLRMELPPRRTLVRALLRRTRDPLIEDRARKWRLGK